MKRANCTLCTLTLMARKCFSNIKKSHKLLLESGGSPGLVVMGGDSCSKGRGFEYQHHVHDVHFSHLLV